jgi:hypothetical protein
MSNENRRIPVCLAAAWWLPVSVGAQTTRVSTIAKMNFMGYFLARRKKLVNPFPGFSRPVR